MKNLFSDTKKTFLFFLALGLLFYGNSIKNDFAIDDSYVTVTNYPVKSQKYVPNNRLVAQGLKGIPKIWQVRYGHESGMAYDYRPVVLTLFAIEYAVFGRAPHINHFISIFLYTLCIFYLFSVLKLCLKQYPYKEPFALICAVLFLAHPVHNEVVNNIKCADELLTFLFGLLTTYHILLFFESKKTKYLFFSAIFILLAYYTKLNSVLFIVLIPITLLFFLKIEKKQVFYVFIGLLALFILHNGIRRLILTENEVRLFYHFENPLFTEDVSFFTKILFALKTLGVYIKLFFIPYPLHFYYGTAMLPLTSSVFDPEIILAVLFLLVTGVYCYKTKNRLAFFGLLFFLITIGPMVNLLTPMVGIVAERFCFMASMGFVIFIVSVLFSLYKTVPIEINNKLFVARPVLWLSVFCIIFLFYTWNRNRVWKDEITLFEHDVPSLEKSAGANNLLANKYFAMLSFSKNNPEQVLVDKCLHHYKLAFTNDSTVYTAFNNTGAITFFYLHKPAEALALFARAINSNPVYPQAYENMADCYDALGKPRESLKNYIKAISQNPQQYRSYLLMIKILARQKQYTAALNLMKIAEARFPNDNQLRIEKENLKNR